MKIESNTIQVQPDSGILINYGQDSSTSYNLAQSHYMPDDSEIILPFPSLDSEAGKSFEMFEIKESLFTSAQDFEDSFGFVGATQN